MPEPSEKPLQSWKEIAAYLERDIRTARRWEKEAGLPVRRHTGGKRSSVYAYPSEIEAWRAGKPVTSPSASPMRGSWAWAAVAAVVALGAVALLLRDATLDPVARAGAAAAAEGVRTTEVCSECISWGGVSPDGRYLSETDWVHSGDIGIRDLQTGEYRRLGDKPSWQEPIGEAWSSLFSPDGQKIAYNWLLERDGELGYELRLIDAFGEAKPKTVYYNREFQLIQPEAWTDDGRLLVLFQRRDWSAGLGFVSIESGQLTVIRSLDRLASHARLSPDGRWIVYDVPNAEDELERDIFLVATDGSEEKRIVGHSANDFALGFAPDSNTLLFASNRTGSYGIWGLGISDLGEAGEPQMLLRDIGSVDPIGIASDGALFYARSLGSVDLFRAELDLDSGRLLGEPRVVETKHQGSNVGPWLSPNGQSLAYMASPGVSRGAAGASDQLWIRDRASGEDRRVPTDRLRLVGYYGLAWAPDSERILFPGRDKSGRWGFYETDLEPPKLKKLPIDQAEDFNPGPIGWAPDGRSVLFSWRSKEFEDGRREKAIVRLGPADWKLERIATLPDETTAVSLSPQRDRIAWRERRAPEPIKIISLTGDLEKLVPWPTAAEGSILRDFAWTPDGDGLLLTVADLADAGGLTKVHIVSLDGGAPRETDLAAQNLRYLSVHPDGKTVSFTAGSQDFRIFKTENYLPKVEASTE